MRRTKIYNKEHCKYVIDTLGGSLNLQQLTFDAPELQESYSDLQRNQNCQSKTFLLAEII